MPYLLNEPVATDRLSTSQPKLRDNTNTANSSFGTDHYAFNDGTANNGKHKVIRTPAQAADPATDVNEPAIYSKSIFSTVPRVLQFSKIGGLASGTNGAPLTSVNVSGDISTGIGAAVELFDAAGAGADTMIRCAILVRTVTVVPPTPAIYNFNEIIFSFNGTSFQTQASPAPSNATFPIYIYQNGSSALGMLLSASGSKITLINTTGVTQFYNATITFINIT